MEWIKPGTNYNILNQSKWAIPISIFLVCGSLSLFWVKGFNYSIDFVGGLELRAEFAKNVTIDQVRKDLSDLNLESLQVNQFVIPGKNVFSIKVKGHKLIEKEREKAAPGEFSDLTNTILTSLQAKFGKEVSIVSADMVGPRVGAVLRQKGVWALIASFIGMLIYVGFRFNFRYAPGGIIAIIHDVVITAGLFSLLGKEMSLTIVAALLTIAGYSINDTIVIFDRIREGHTLYRKLALNDLVNRCINDTLSRTFLTNFVTALSIVPLYFFGGAILRDFSFAMLFGIVIGTYSTVYIASPIYILLEKMITARRKRVRR